MNAENVQEILDVLAAQFGTTAEHLWGVMLRQAYIGAAVDLVFAAGAVLLIRALIRAGVKQSDKNLYDQSYPPFVAYAVALVVGLVAVVEVWSSVGYAANPEYFALKTVLELLP